MSSKRPLDVAAPEQGAAPSPRKRLRRAVLVMMWLKPRAIAMEQMAVLIRQLMLILLMALFEQSTTQRLLLERLDVLQRIIEGMMREQPGMIQSAVRAVMHELRAAPLSVGVQQPPRNPPLCRPQLNLAESIPQGMEDNGGTNQRFQLRFANSNNPKDLLYTGCTVKWQNESNVKVAVYENDNQVTHGDISKVKVDILAVRSEFFTERGQENFTKEEFDKQICMCGDKELVLATVDLINGEHCLGSFCFTESSHRKKWRLAARVKSQFPRVRFQEAFTGPFVVKDRRSKLNAKSYPPRKEDDVHRLEKISPSGKYCVNLEGKRITKVKHLLRHYHRDESGLQKITGMKKQPWKVMIKHAKKCDPGNELYSYSVVEENYVLFFNDFYDLVGIELDGSYNAYGNLGQSQQEQVNKCKMAAHKRIEELEESGSLNPDYVMINGRPSLVPSNDVGPSTQPTLTSQQYSLDQSLVTAEFGHQSPFAQQNGPSYYNSQRNIMNGQCSGTSQPPNAFEEIVPLQYDELAWDASQGFQFNRSICSSTAAGACSFYSVIDRVEQQTSLLGYGEVFSQFSPVDDALTMLLNEHGGHHGSLPANNAEEPANSDNPAYGCDGNHEL